MVGNINSTTTNNIEILNNNENCSSQQSQQPSTSSSTLNSCQTSPIQQNNYNSLNKINKQILKHSIATICLISGFTNIQTNVLNILTTLSHKYLSQLCCSSRELCEHTGRSLITPSDVFLAIINSGIDVQKFPEFLNLIKRAKTPPQFTVKSQSPVKSPPILRISDPRPHPQYFPNFLPPFPDPHTYIRTEVKDDIDNTYEKVRYLTAANKRDTEKSLINYALYVYPSICVFQELAMKLQFESKDQKDQQDRQEQKGISQNLLINNNNVNTNGQDDVDDDILFLENGNADPIKIQERRETPEKDEKRIKREGDDQQQKNFIKSTNASSFNKKAETTAIGSASTLQDLYISEEQLKLRDTEKSYVFRRIPPYCHILLPFEDSNPYITALITDDIDITDSEEHNYFASILSKEMEEEEEEELIETNDNNEDEQGGMIID